MSLLSQFNGLNVLLRSSLLTASAKLVLQVQNLGDVGNVANDLHRQQGGSETRTVGENGDSLTLQLLVTNEVQNRGQGGPTGGSVHVTGIGGQLQSWSESAGRLLLSKTKEDLFEVSVGQGLFVSKGQDLVEGLLVQLLLESLWVGNEIVVQQSSERLGDQLTGWHVECRVVEVVQKTNGLTGTNNLLAVVLVSVVKRLGVTGQREVAVNNRVLGGEVWLVEVVGVLHVGTSHGVKHNRSVWTNEHGHGTNTTSRSGGTLGVDGNVTGDHNGVSAVPRGRLDPVDSVDHRRGTTVTSVDGVHTLDVVVVAKQLHQHGLDRLGLVQKGLGTDLQSTNGVWVDVVVLQQTRGGGERERVDVLSVVDERHVGLAQANCVLSGGNAVELFQLFLVDETAGDVDLKGLDTDVLGGHGAEMCKGGYGEKEGVPGGFFVGGTDEYIYSNGGIRQYELCRCNRSTFLCGSARLRKRVEEDVCGVEEFGRGCGFWVFT